MLALNWIFSWLVLNLLPCSLMEVGGSKAAVPLDGACWGLNLRRPQGRWVLPCLELWGSSAGLSVQLLGSVCFQVPTCALRNLLVAAIVAWFGSVELCSAI